MSATLACCWAFSPWRHEAATTAAAWLEQASPGPLDVLRADLDSVGPRELPRPAIDARIRRSRSLLGTGLALDAPAIAAYAEQALTAARAWIAAHGAYQELYSGPAGLADHLVAALLRGEGAATRWTAHVADLPTHRPDGTSNDAAMNEALRALLPEPARRADTVVAASLALLDRADRIVVASAEIGELLRAHPAFTATAPMTLWQRPGMTPPLDGDGISGLDSGASIGALVATVDATTLARLDPILLAYSLLSREEQHQLPLRVYTNQPKPLGELLRRRGVEARVSVAADPAPGAALAHPARAMLVLDGPVPQGRLWSPLPRPELADAAAAGVPVLLVAEQDSPLTALPGVRHIPAGHPSATVAVLRELAAG